MYLLSLPPFTTFFLKYAIIRDLFLSEFVIVSLFLILISVFNAVMYINVLIRSIAAEKLLDRLNFQTDIGPILLPFLTLITFLAVFIFTNVTCLPALINIVENLFMHG